MFFFIYLILCRNKARHTHKMLMKIIKIFVVFCFQFLLPDAYKDGGVDGKAPKLERSSTNEIFLKGLLLSNPSTPNKELLVSCKFLFLFFVWENSYNVMRLFPLCHTFTAEVLQR